MGELPGVTPKKTVVDLENCRFTLPEEGVRELAYVSDELSKVFLAALTAIEKQWGAQYFPFIGKGSVMVGICTMPRWLWNNILAFAEEHDCAQGESVWHIFDAARASLRPYTPRPHPLYEQGYHSSLSAWDEADGLIYGDDVLIVWSPSSSTEEEIGQRKWWPCDYVLSWIENELIPAVGNWANENSKKGAFFSWSRKRKLLKWWQEHAKVKDVRIRPISEGERYRVVGLKETVEILQCFYNSYGANKEIFFPENKMRKLYLALITVLRGGRGHASYIAGNLQFGKYCDTHAEIIEQLQVRLQESGANAHSTVIDYRLRALLAALDQDDSWLRESDKEQVFDALLPLMEFYDQQMLVRRHSKWM